ncbi:uncharacterized protein METZ01_LOCUS306314 [marine metagenome]|uniref:Uncharacterized protein n=1 Tax=marine metagenome TaxID=408172 RepID=A0A382MY69_9ZZZZ
MQLFFQGKDPETDLGRFLNLCYIFF